MSRVASPYVRVTTVIEEGSAAWQKYWLKSVNKVLLEQVPKELVTYAAIPHTENEWREWLRLRTCIAETDRISDESKHFGTHVHAIAQNYLIQTPLPDGLTERELFCGSLLVKWCKEAKVKPLILDGKPAVELDLKSEVYKYTGHPDLVCTFGDDSTIWVIDWKTSAKYRRGYALQVAAYAQAIYEMYKVPISHGGIIRTPNDPTVMPQFEVHEVHGLMETYFSPFLHALETYKYFQKKDQWKKLPI